MAKKSSPRHITETHVSPRGNARSYVVGFVFCLTLTLIAYFLVAFRNHHTLPNEMVYFAVITSCVIQFVIQMIYFLHLGEEPKPYWNALVFAFMALVVFILVGGSLWIMYSLNQRMGMTS